MKRTFWLIFLIFKIILKAKSELINFGIAYNDKKIDKNGNNFFSLDLGFSFWYSEYSISKIEIKTGGSLTLISNSVLNFVFPILVNNYKISNLIDIGVEVVYNETYAHDTQSDVLLSYKTKCLAQSVLCVAGGSSNSDELIIISCGNCYKILIETAIDTPNFENSAYWYLTRSKSFGFSPTQSIYQASADTNDGSSNQRISWHLDQNAGGYRLGNILSLNSDTNYRKYIFLKKFLSVSYEINIFMTDLNLNQDESNIFYRTVSNKTELNSIRFQIIQSFPNYFYFNPKNALIITWFKMKHSFLTIQGNVTFQSIIISNDLVSFLIFNYDGLYLTSVPLINIGFDHKYSKFQYIKSLKNQVLDVAEETNCNFKGRWIFKVDGKTDVKDPEIKCGKNYLFINQILNCSINMFADYVDLIIDFCQTKQNISISNQNLVFSIAEFNLTCTKPGSSILSIIDVLSNVTVLNKTIDVFLVPYSIILDTLNLSNPKLIEYSSSLIFKSVNFVNSSLSFSITTIWQIFKIDESKKIDLTGIASSNQLELNIPAGFLNYGLYKLNLTTLFLSEFNFYSFDETYFKIIEINITVNGLENGTQELILSKNQSFKIEPSKFSYDNYNFIKKENLTFKFYCKSNDKNESNYFITNDLIDLFEAKRLNYIQNNSCFKNNTLNGLEFDSTGNSLLIKEFSLDNTLDRINKFLILTMYNNKSFTQLINVKVIPDIILNNLLPFNGTCFIDLYEGFALSTYFNIKCENWTGLEGPIKKYEYYAKNLNGDNVYNLGYNNIGNISIQLPLGLESDSYNLCIYIQIFDISEKNVLFNIAKPVMAKKDQTIINNILSSLVSLDSNSDIIKNILNNDTEKSLIQITLVSSILNINSDLDQEPSNKINKIKNFLINIVTKMNATNLKTLNLLSGSLSLLSENSDKISKNSSTKIINKMTELTVNLISYSLDSDFDKIESIGKSIASSTGNVLSILSYKSGSNLNDDFKNNVINQFSDISKNLLETYSKYLNDYHQDINIKSNSIVISYKQINLENQTDLKQNNVKLPENLDHILNQNQTIIQQLIEIPNAILVSNSTGIENSSMLTLSLHDEFNSEIRVNDTIKPFVFKIPRLINSENFEFKQFNSSSINQFNLKNRLVTFSIDTSDKNVSLSFYLKPANICSSYFIFVKFGDVPFLNGQIQDFDFYEIFCIEKLKSLMNELVYDLFLNIQTIRNNLTNKQNKTIGIGLRELSDQETNKFCFSHNKIDLNLNFSLIYKNSSDKILNNDFCYLIVSTGCYYLDKSTNKWYTEGMEVVNDLNLNYTHCLSYHLTDFAGGILILPAKIDFDYVFSNSSFDKNPTIYITLIVISCAYILLFIWTRYMDFMDDKKAKIYLLENGFNKKNYFYEIIVFTGNRKGSGTNSNVLFNLSGDFNESINISLNKHLDKKYVLQRSSVDTFIMPVKKSLGYLNYIRIWHDNSGKSKSSWFLKYIIVHDLQTTEKFYFLCNKWFALDKEDGLIDRLIPVSGDKQKNDLKYLIEKETKQKLSDNHLWFSIFARPVLSSFNRTDRLTCCFVLLLLTAMMNILYYEQDKSSDQDFLKIGPFNLSQAQIVIGIISNLIIFPPSFILIQLFRRSKKRITRSMEFKNKLNQIITKNKQTNNLDLNRKRKKSKNKQIEFPWWFKIVSYILCLIISGVCAFFIIVKGIQFGNEKVGKWLTSFLVSVLSSFLLTQPIQVALMSLFFVCLFRKTNDENDLDFNPLDNENYTNKKKDSIQSNEYEQCKNNYYEFNNLNQLNKIDLKKFKEKRDKDNLALKYIKQIILYFSFVWIVFIVCYSKSDHHSFNYKNSIENLFELNKNMIQNKNVFEWLKNNFLPNLASKCFYNQNLTNLNNYINDLSSILVGNIYLRQSRVKNESCLINLINNKCFYDYSVFNEDKNGYHFNLSNLNISQTIKKAFFYTKSTDLESYPYTGHFGTYLGGGYVYEFNNSNLNETELEIDVLQKLNWIDKQTRALFIEFTLYNPNINLFAYFTILFEYLSTGNILKTVDINPFNLYTYETSFSILSLTCDILYFVFILFFMIKEIRKLIKNSFKKYIRNFWSYIEWCLIILSCSSFAIYALRIYLKNDIFDKLKNNQNIKNMIKFQNLSYLNNLLIYMMGFCSFLSTLKFIKLLRFNRNISFIIETLKMSFESLCGFLIVFCLILIAFIQLMYLLLLEKSNDFETFLSSAESLFQVMLGKFKTDIFEMSTFIEPFVFILYNFWIIFILLNMFITIISNNYSTVRYSKLNKDESIIICYLKEKINCLFRKKKNVFKEQQNILYKDFLDSFRSSSFKLIETIETYLD